MGSSVIPRDGQIRHWLTVKKRSKDPGTKHVENEKEGDCGVGSDGCNKRESVDDEKRDSSPNWLLV